MRDEPGSDGKLRAVPPKPDPETVAFGYSHDGIAYYVGYKEIAGVDYASFTVLNKRYSKDVNFVYHFGNRIEDADAASFEVVGPTTSVGRDKNFDYFVGERRKTGK